MSEQPTGRDPTPPSFETLLRLKQNLPSMMKEIQRRAKGKKPKGTPAKRMPRKWCAMCTAVFDYAAMTEMPKMESGFCPSCVRILESGCIGIMDEQGRSAFIKLTPELEEGLGAFIPARGEPGPEPKRENYADGDPGDVMFEALHDAWKEANDKTKRLIVLTFPSDQFDNICQAQGFIIPALPPQLPAEDGDSPDNSAN